MTLASRKAVGRRFYFCSSLSIMAKSSSPEDGTLEFDHFVHAQAGVYDQVVGELENGRKQSHWMWFIFPQLEGLGRSEMARKYAIPSLDAAHRYLQHPILGQRLRECGELVNQHRDASISDIFGYPDDLKFHSCMTLFNVADPAETRFFDALSLHFGGARDALTLGLLER